MMDLTNEDVLTILKIIDESDYDADDIAARIEKYYDKIKAFVSA